MLNTTVPVFDLVFIFTFYKCCSISVAKNSSKNCFVQK